MESKKRMITGSGMARESRGPMVTGSGMVRESRVPMMRPEADESTTRAMRPSVRPRMRPADLEERMDERRLRDLNEMYNRQDEGPSRRQMEQGFKEGGMVTGTGSRAQTSGTKFSGTF